MSDHEHQQPYQRSQLLDSIRGLPVDTQAARNETTDEIRRHLRILAHSLNELSKSFRHTGNPTVGDRLASGSAVLNELEMKLQAATTTAISEEWKKARNTPAVRMQEALNIEDKLKAGYIAPAEIVVRPRWPALDLEHEVTLPMNRSYKHGALYERVFKIAGHRYQVRAYAVGSRASAAGGKLLVAWDPKLDKALTGEEDGSLNGDTETTKVNGVEYVVTVAVPKEELT